MTDYVVSSGNTATGVNLTTGTSLLTYHTGDTQEVLSGGLSVATIVNGLSLETVSTGGAARGSVINGGGMLVDAGGTASETVVNFDTYSLQNLALPTGLEVDGTALNTTVTGNGSVYVAPGGVATTIIDSSGGFLNNYTSNHLVGVSVAGAASGVVIEALGTESVAAGGTTTATVVNSGGAETVSGGGTSNSTTVNGGGTSTVLGIANGSALNGGQQTIASGGVANNAVVNSGGAQTIASGGLANALTGNGGGSETVLAGGSVTGATLNGGSSLSNAGIIAAASGGSGDAVAVSGGATITNTGTISGSGLGVLADAASSVAITNSGLIQATGAAGVAIALSGGGTITNSGTITGGGTGKAVAGVTRLIIEQGQVITGTVQGVGGPGGVLELGSGTGTLAGLGSQYTGFGTVQVDAGQNWTLNGPSSLADGSSLTLGDGSTLAVAGGALTDSGSGTIAFQGVSHLITGAGTAGFTLTGMAVNDTIVLSNIGYASSDTINVVGSTVTVANAAGLSDSFIIAGAADEKFALSSVTGGATELAIRPQIASVAASPSAPGTLGAGGAITFSLAPAVPLTLNTSEGVPTLSLSDGGTAAFDGTASSAGTLVFRTTIAAGQNATDLHVSGYNAAGSAFVDAAGTLLDPSTVGSLAGSDTGIVVDTAPASVAGVTTMAGASGGTVFTTAASGSNTVTATASGNDVVNSLGTDTVQAGGGSDVVYASGPAATVIGGAGNLTFVAGAGAYNAGGGTGTDILYGGNGADVLTGGAGKASIIVAGFGNTSLVGGAGSAVLMFGGFGASTFTGSTGGADTMVGGAGANTFAMTNGDIGFGGPNGPDTFSTGSGNSLLVEGAGATQINLGGGTTTAFEGAGADTYSIGKGLHGIANITGFKAGDHITLTGGFTSADASDAVGKAMTGAFGTSLHLSDGSQVNLFGVTLTASQVSAA